MCGINSHTYTWARVGRRVQVRPPVRPRPHDAYRTYRTHRTRPLSGCVPHTARDTPHIPHLKKMAAQITTKTIRATPDNVTEMRDLVKRWPQLNGLVRHLQEQNLFPGLRGLQITLTGRPEWVAKGLGAVQPSEAVKAQESAQ